jgi:hypothetical protein
MFSNLWLKFQVNWSSRRHGNTGQQMLYEFCYSLPFDLWTSYLVRILFLQGCGSWFWEFPSSTRICNIGQTGFMNFVICFLLTCGVSIWQGSFSYKDVVACFGNLLVLQGSLMGCNIVSKSVKDSLMFQNSFLIRIPYSS